MLDVVSAWNCNLASTCGLSCSSRCIQFVYCSRCVWLKLSHAHTLKSRLTLMLTFIPTPSHSLTHTLTHHTHSHSHTHSCTHTLTLTHTLLHPHSHTHSHTIITLPPRMFLTINSLSILCLSNLFSVYFRVRAGHENSKEALLLVHQVRCGKYPSLCAVTTLSISVCCGDTIHLCVLW